MSQMTSLFDGHNEQEASQDTRLVSQLERVYRLMCNGTGWTLEDLSLAANAPTSSVSSRIRDLRKPRFGGNIIQRVHEHGGIYTYWLVGEPRPLLDGKGQRSLKAVARSEVEFLMAGNPNATMLTVRVGLLLDLMS